MKPIYTKPMLKKMMEAPGQFESRREYYRHLIKTDPRFKGLEIKKIEQRRYIEAKKHKPTPVMKVIEEVAVTVPIKVAGIEMEFPGNHCTIAGTTITW